jgi:hypothetical protein
MVATLSKIKIFQYYSFLSRLLNMGGRYFLVFELSGCMHCIWICGEKDNLKTGALGRTQSL